MGMFKKSFRNRLFAAMLLCSLIPLLICTMLMVQITRLRLDSRTREDGAVFEGEMIAPWKPWEALDIAQREYERQQYESMEAELADARQALAILGVKADA